MAIPRLNHTQLPNEFIDKYMHQVSPAATKVFLAICRKTIGWHKMTDDISSTQLIEMTGMSKNTVKSAVDELVEIGLIIKYKRGYGKGQETCYTINFEKQIPESTQIYRSNIDPKTKKGKIYGSKIDPKNDGYGSKIDPKDAVYGSKIDPTKEIVNKDINKGTPGFKNLISQLEIDLADASPHVNRILKGIANGLYRAPETRIELRGNQITVSALTVEFKMLIDAMKINDRYQVVESEVGK